MRAIIFFLVVFLVFVTQDDLLAQYGRNHKVVAKGNLEVPHTRNLEWNSTSAMASEIYQNWANKPLLDWQEKGKVSVPRIILGHLLMNKDIDEINKYILTLQPRGRVGASWLLNPKGDYDFTLTTLVTILYLFDNQPDKLYPETKKHLTDVLMTMDGGKFHGKTPRTFKTIKDSENHVLMIESSRYLKNRYLMLHGNKEQRFDNVENGLEERLIKELHLLKKNGLHEFNSYPYIGYTIAPLLNLEAFASTEVRNAARDVLDYIFYCYALGSYQWKSFPPFRRQYVKAKNTNLSNSYLASFMKAWMSYLPEYETIEISHGKHMALIASCMPYRPTDEVVNLINNKGNGYFVKLGHGRLSSPEIYTAGKHYLLSAGGVNRGKSSVIVARPICLFLDDEAKELSDLFYLKGKSDNFMKWNNTGVYQNFACTNGDLHIPEGYYPTYSNDLWDFYQMMNKVLIAVHSSDDVSIMLVFEDEDIAVMSKKLMKLNPQQELLKEQFVFPSGTVIKYDVESSRRKWVIREIDGKPTQGRFGLWPLLDGSFVK